MKKVWLITGCSTGFGRALANELLSIGYRVALTARNIADIQDLVSVYPDTAIAIMLDVTVPQQIIDAVKTTISHFGTIDVTLPQLKKAKRKKSEGCLKSIFSDLQE